MFGGKNVILDGEGTGTIDGNGQTFYDARVSCLFSLRRLRAKYNRLQMTVYDHHIFFCLTWYFLLDLNLYCGVQNPTRLTISSSVTSKFANRLDGQFLSTHQRTFLSMCVSPMS